MASVTSHALYEGMHLWDARTDYRTQMAWYWQSRRGEDRRQRQWGCCWSGASQQTGAHPNLAVPPAAWCSPQSSSAHVCLLLMPCQDGGAVKGVLTNPGAGGKWEVASCSCAGITPLVSTHEAEVQLRWHHAPGLDA